MTSASIPWWISAVWVALTFLTALAVDASSVNSWVLAAMLGTVPALVFISLWNDGPPLTVAEVLYATETGR